MNPTIHIAFRFHGNFYHSYRGDTPDELGFGKDIRIIHHIIKTLDDFNHQGLPVCGTWDFENYFSLETLIPQYCPDILENLQRRVNQGTDEIQIMSYNNGLVSAHTAKEFEAAIQWSITNHAKSGLADLFGKNFQTSVRPQEMMYTPIHVKLYPANGINTISLFYSGLPFNGFSNFIPKLSLEERYNPLTLTYPGISETMTLLPCYNVGDLIDHLSLRRWVKQLRHQQMKNHHPKDLLLIIDMDADDQFWTGFDIPVLKSIYPTIQGLKGMIDNIKDLTYIRFTTPDRYLKDHPPLNEIEIRQDTADGSFDGYASWAEKWSNQRIWSGLERIRLLTYQTRHLFGESTPPEIDSLLKQAFEIRIKLLSTTHFGMAAPVMNLTRENCANDLVKEGISLVNRAWQSAVKPPLQGDFSLIDYRRGENTAHINYPTTPSKGLIRLPLKNFHAQAFSLKNEQGETLPNIVITRESQQELIFFDTFKGGQQKQYIVEPKPQENQQHPMFKTDQTGIENEWLKLQSDQAGQINLKLKNHQETNLNLSFSSKITYAKMTREVSLWKKTEFEQDNGFNLLKQSGEIQIDQTHFVNLEREFILHDQLPYLYLNVRVLYPQTPPHGFNKAKAARLQQGWDTRWSEVIPCEIHPTIFGNLQNPLKIWKHNYFGHISSYELDYGQFSNNHILDNVNNHITHAWVALSNGKTGILVAQTAEVNSSLAFCPMRTRKTAHGLQAALNPFGSYWGKQYNYATADTGFGKFLTTTMSTADHINPLAPSYNGKTQQFSLLIAPYLGDQPDLQIQNDALAFAYPYIVLDPENIFNDPPHRTWDSAGLGTK